MILCLSEFNELQSAVRLHETVDLSSAGTTFTIFAPSDGAVRSLMNQLQSSPDGRSLLDEYRTLQAGVLRKVRDVHFFYIIYIV